MAVPKFYEFFISLLTFLSDSQEHSIKEISDYCVKYFNLSDEDITIVLPSGDNMLINRVGWARFYLMKADD